MTPMWSDDFLYSFIWGTNDRVASISDIIYSQYRHYYTWGGRIVAHSIAQYLLLIPPFVADILNSFVYILYSFLVYIHIKGRQKKQSISVFVFIFILTWFFQPDYGGTILWLTGSANYLWSTTLILLFLLPYRLYGGEKKIFKTGGFFKFILIFIIGVFAGWTNENVAPAVIIMLCVFLFLYKKQKYEIPKWAVGGMVGLIIGTTILLIAPGNYERLAVSKHENISLFLYYFKFNLYNFRLFSYIGNLLVLTSILIVLALYFMQTKKSLFLCLIMIYIIGVFFPVYIMLVSPEFPARSHFFSVTCLIIAFGITYISIDNNISFLRTLKVVILAVFLFGFTFDFYISYKRIKMVDIASKEREALIIDKRAKGFQVIIVPNIESNCKYVQGDYFPPDFVSMSKYYNVKLTSDTLKIEK